MLNINDLAPEFNADAFVDGEIKKINLLDYRGKWIVLFFYPADFTFVCPTELGELAQKYEKIKSLGGEVLSVSTDTVFVHKAWHDNSPTIKKIKFPMIADPSQKICKNYNTLIKEEGLAIRATYIIDPDGRIKAFEFHDNSIGRNIDEVIRKIEAAKFVREKGQEVCPANWKPGDKTIKPGIELVGKI
ncbi:MAG: peroxiredoxin [Candidatus Anstonellaceae archaeon]